MAAEALSSHRWFRPLLIIADLALTEDEPLTPAVRDLDQVAHQALGLDGTAAILLVRPDGRLSFRDHPSNPAALVEHVAMIAGYSRQNT